MFATDIGLSLLAESDTWFRDGHFGLASDFFKQLYVKRVQKKNQCLLQLFISSSYIYEEMFNIIINECKTRDMYLAPRIWYLIKKMKMEVAADQAKLALSNVEDRVQNN
ncbi:unnamed protein product [Macrosiphum euphorbiae]|uniref:Uncharacterized protein n=1 Tax=Macrosiphum euphorbiae TaxID=13131 RepID=A0AAV0VI02_9HEMI|nr:unnamed protein product [Macrosiphum euphorbiae]